MTDKQLEGKKEQFVLDANSLLERELTENDLDIIFHWISKLVEEVEREQFGKARLIGEPFRKTEEDDEHGSYGTSFEN